jgi:secretion/DNA translocation related TadE-like protein
VLLAGALVVLLITLAVVALGQHLAGRARAQAAADASALAAAPVTFRPFGAEGSPRQEAALFAAANDATLTACRCPEDPSWEPRTVVVTVRVEYPVILFGRQYAEATARAEFVPTKLLR